MNFLRTIPNEPLHPPANWPEPGVANQAVVADAAPEPHPEPEEPARADTTEADEPQPVRPIADFLNRARQSFYLYSGLLIALFGFYALSDFTAYMTGQERPGQLIFSNTMTQLWTAAFRLTFVLGASLGVLRLFWPELFRFFRPDTTDGPDMINTIRFELTPYQRICVFLLVFFGICGLFVLLLSVNLPQTVSVGR